jgi:phage gpG-like protein
MSQTVVRVVRNNTAAIRGTITGDALKKAAMAGGQYIQTQAMLNVNKTFSSKSVGAAGLGGSIKTVLDKADNTSAWVDVGPTVIYGRIQELGGIVKPVHAKKLAIPLPGTKGKPGDYSDLHVQGFGGMVATLVNAAGKVLFILKDMVQIPPRPYLRPAVDEHEKDIEQAVQYHLKKAIEKVAGE